MIHRLQRQLFGVEGDVVSSTQTQLIVLTSGIMTIGGGMVSPILADLSIQYGVTETEIGWFMTLYTVPPIVLIPVFGITADRVGRKPLIISGLLLYGAAGTALALTQTYEYALVLRLLQGIGFAAVMPLTITLLGDLYDEAREATAQGIRSMVNSGCLIVAPMIAGVLALFSWRYPFLIFGLTLPFALLFWLSFSSIEVDSNFSFRSYFENMFELLKRTTMALLLSSFIIRYIVFFGFLTYISVLITNEIGRTAIFAGIVVSLKMVASTASAGQAGRASLKFSREATLSGSFALVSIGMIVIGAYPSFGTMIVGTVLLGVGDGLISPVQKSLLVQMAPTHLRAGAVSVASTFQNVGKSAAPLFMGLLIGLYGISVAFVLVGLVGCVGVITVLSISELESRPTA